jgi:hypothetical protein
MVLDALCGGLQHLLEVQKKWRDVYRLVFLEHQMFDDQAILVNLKQKITCNFIL